MPGERLGLSELLFLTVGVRGGEVWEGSPSREHTFELSLLLPDESATFQTWCITVSAARVSSSSDRTVDDVTAEESPSMVSKAWGLLLENRGVNPSNTSR